jgi:hypothetical protein
VTRHGSRFTSRSFHAHGGIRGEHPKERGAVSVIDRSRVPVGQGFEFGIGHGRRNIHGVMLLARFKANEWTTLLR